MSRFALPPRAALVLVGIVVLVAVGVVWLGGRTDGDGGADTGVTVVSGAPTVAASDGDGDGGAGAGSAAAPTGTGAGAGTGARAGAGAGSVGAEPSASAAVAVVYVVGAVAHPGVVRLHAGDRVTDALDAAGGAAADADLTRLNLARPAVDGERLYVPRAGETEVPAELPAGDGPGGASGGGTAGGDGTDGSVPADTVVDLNTADAMTLETLPGIGPAMAQRILTWREEHGGFRTVEDLLEVSGIGDARFAELRDRVRV
ncbi:helix-hairpin-helix domain-containing protein [Curtobacterium sp. MCBD17_008]|uniref:helix-hairpin-helix domain-containing protein n=1 Tax=Curtobacterium sp. MCBD17_008 TaxID=2175656 RepID=UPI000DA87BAC|nr:helix-hairpin-helix domain-containing protein [Curtobacterium sp. MCBD17_008]PZE92555.1 ComEA family DNA-binding protein [Curtobacterium sp. MCBD17_008]